MKLNDLQIFVDIVDAGGLTAAANRRGVTQPAISRVLRDLETRLQAQLLIRTGRGIELTPAGEAFLNFAEETLERFSDTRKRILDQAKVLPSELRMSVPLRVGRLLIPSLYRAFTAQMPETTVHIFEEDSQRAREMLGDGRLDVALTYRSAPKPDRDFVPLVEEDLFAVGHPRTLGRAGGVITAREVSDLPLLLPSSGRYRDLIQASFRTAGHDLRLARALETAEGLLAFAAEGEGVAILPMSNVYQEVARGEVVARQIAAPSITRTVGAGFNTSVSQKIATLVLSVLRGVLQTTADLAHWRRLAPRSGGRDA